MMNKLTGAITFGLGLVIVPAAGRTCTARRPRRCRGERGKRRDQEEVVKRSPKRPASAPLERPPRLAPHPRRRVPTAHPRRPLRLRRCKRVRPPPARPALLRLTGGSKMLMDQAGKKAMEEAGKKMVPKLP